MKKNTLIVIAGPTAVGKTAAAIEIAKHFSTEIISADSRQFYRGMNIGTAVPTTEELTAVKHHFIQSQSIDKPLSAGKYEKMAIKKIDTLFERNNSLVLTGGSGMFIDAIINGIDNGLPPADIDLRNKLETDFELNGINWLQQKLKILDYNYYKEVDLNNPRRLMRAIEVCISTGQTYSELRTNKPKDRSFNVVKICLNREREELYHRINLRVDNMMEAGLLLEVKALLPKKELTSLKTVGYSELFNYLEGNLELAEAVELIKRNTRRYAKRQLTWFKRSTGYQWFEPKETALIIKEIEQQINTGINK